MFAHGPPERFEHDLVLGRSQGGTQSSTMPIDAMEDYDTIRGLRPFVRLALLWAREMQMEVWDFRGQCQTHLQ